MCTVVEAAGVIFENEFEEILVLRRHTQSYEGSTWGLVGGKIERGETSLSAAIREVKEEIGHSISTEPVFLKQYKWKRGGILLVFDLYRVEIRKVELTLLVDPREHTEALWQKPAELYGKPNLMKGLYPILEDMYGVGCQTAKRHELITGDQRSYY